MISHSDSFHTSPSPRIQPPANKLLASLPDWDYERIRPHLKEIELPFGELLYDVGDTIGRLYFPTSGIVSLTLLDDVGKDVEVGVVGREGVAGLGALLATEAAVFRTMVQVQGSALFLPVNIAREEFDRSGPFQKSVLRYTEAHLMQTAQNALCNVRHSVEERLCRWLLTVADRVESDKFTITHEFMAMMLGTRRSGVTIIAGTLRAAGLVDYSRSRMQLLDREGLEETSCGCYRAIRDHFQRPVD